MSTTPSERHASTSDFAAAAASPAWRNPAIYLAAAWSGFFVMGVELLGGRLLAPYFGNSIFVWGALITVFMTCLAIGYLLGGKLSLQTPRLKTLGILLMFEATLALPIVFAGDWMLDQLSFAVPDPRYGSLLGSAMLFGAATVFSGMVSPYAVRLLVRDVAKAGREAGILYFVSTLGSAGGTIMTTFYLVLFMEIDTIILTLISISLAIGIALFLIGRRHDAL